MENNFENNVPETAAPAANFVDKAKAGVTGVISKVKADPKGFGVKLGAIVLAAIIVIVGLFVGIGAATNNYKTPLKLSAKVESAKKYDFTDRFAVLNGFCAKEVKAIYKLVKGTENAGDALEYLEERFMDGYDYVDYVVDEDGNYSTKKVHFDGVEDKKEEYGSNYKYKVKVVEKEKLEDSDLEDFEETIQDFADRLKDWVKEAKDMSSDELEKYAEAYFDGSKKDAKKYIELVDKVRAELKGAKVTKGYEVVYDYSVNGKNLDEAEVLDEEEEINVYKVNGKWITYEALYVISSATSGDPFGFASDAEEARNADKDSDKDSDEGEEY